MTEHSLYHTLSISRCRTGWESLLGGTEVRSCPRCKATVYRLADLPEQDAAQLIRSTEYRHGDSLRLYRRLDGTFATSNPPCNKMVPQRFHDYYNAVALVLSVSRRSPILTMCFLGVELLYRAVLWTNADLCLLLGPLLAIMSSGITVVLMCRTIRVADQEYRGHNWRPEPVDLARLPSSFGLCILYEGVKTLALGLLIFPGAFFVVRSMLALTIHRLEGRNVFDSFNESIKLTKGHFWEAVDYMFPAGLACTVAWLVTLLTPVYLNLPLCSLVMLTCAPLQVSFYHRLRTRRLIAGQDEQPAALTKGSQ